MKFSVIIPAYNEAEDVAKPIAALQQQTVPRDQFEVVVVDNNSHDDTAAAARRAGADKVVVETKQGTNFARQRGVDESSGEIVAFLDADSEPPADWLEHIARDLALPGVAAVSGPYDYGFTGWHRSADAFYAHRLLPRLSALLAFIFRWPAGVLIGGNFATRRAALVKIGGLPPLAYWGDDAATAMLISRHVGKVLFDPDLNVRSSPRRFEKRGFFRLTFGYARAYFRVYFDKQYR